MCDTPKSRPGKYSQSASECSEWGGIQGSSTSTVYSPNSSCALLYLSKPVRQSINPIPVVRTLGWGSGVTIELHPAPWLGNWGAGLSGPGMVPLHASCTDDQIAASRVGRGELNATKLVHPANAVSSMGRSARDIQLVDKQPPRRLTDRSLLRPEP